MTPALFSEHTFFSLSDDLGAYAESLDMLDAQLAESLEPDERADLERQRGEVHAAMEVIGRELANKTDAVAAVLRRMGTERGVIKEERDRLKRKDLAMERGEKWLRQYVVSTMQANGKTQIKTAMNTLFLRTTEAVDITDAEKVPEQYFNAEVKLPLWLWRAIMAKISADYVEAPELAAQASLARVKAEPSLTAIKKAIKAGHDVAGADLKQNQSLVCR